MVQFLYQYFNVDIGTSYIIMFCSLLPLTFYVLIECRKSILFFDKLMILTLLFLNFVQGEPNHVIIMLGVYLVWISIKNPGLHDSVRYLKLMLGIPFLSGLLWLVFPFNPLIYFSALIWLNIAFLFPKKGAFIKKEQIAWSPIQRVDSIDMPVPSCKNLLDDREASPDIYLDSIPWFKPEHLFQYFFWS